MAWLCLTHRYEIDINLLTLLSGREQMSVFSPNVELFLETISLDWYRSPLSDEKKQTAFCCISGLQDHAKPTAMLI